VGENSGNVEDSGKRFSPITLAGPLFAVLACIAAMLAGFGSRIGLWDFRAGIEILRGSGYLAFLAVVLSVAGAVFCLKRKRKGLIAATSGLVLGLVLLSFLVQLRLKAHNVPPIHDITTDIVNPPQFVAILPVRSDAPNSAAYGGAEIAIKQLQAYPDIKSLVMEQPFEQAFATALGAARSMGWNIVATDNKAGRIEATATTFWFGFKDDIVIRIASADLRSIIDVRSVSRVGRSDLGANAERIRDFLDKVRHNVYRQP
jgi:hypothetical protein